MIRVLAALLVAYLAVPLVTFFLQSPGGSTVDGLSNAVWLSIVTATCATIIALATGIPLSWWLARSRSKFVTAVRVFVQIPLALPPLMSGIVLVYLVGPYTFLGRLFDGGLTDSVVGIVLAQVFVSAPFLVTTVDAAFRSIEPELFDVAASLGHHSFAQLRKVAIPVASKGIVAGALLCWLRAFGEFGATVVLAYNPHSLPVYTYVAFSGGGIPATVPAVFMTIVVTVVVVVLSRYFPTIHFRHRSRTRVVEVAENSVFSFDVKMNRGPFTIYAVHGPTRALGILGTSGAGKSSLIQAIIGILPATGSVRLGSRDVAGLAAQERRIGYVPQAATLYPHLTVREQVCFGRWAAESDWLARLGIAELADRLPSQISGGQAKRVALARALASAPEVVVLDEPFAGLDTPTRRQLRADFRALFASIPTSLIIVTHDPADVAALATDVIVLSQGKVIGMGPQADLFTNPRTPEVASLVGYENVGEQGISAAANVKVTSDEPHNATVLDSQTLAGHHELTLVTNDGIQLTATTREVHLVGTRIHVEIRQSS
jgi:molybdate transport system permease protein